MEIKIHCKYDELVNPKDLKEHPKNRNKHGQDQIERLAELYKYHGIRHPIICDAENKTTIIAGRGRQLAALRSGIKEFPVVYQKFDSQEHLYAFLQADNAIASWAELDIENIKLDIGDFPDLDLNMLGIRDFQVDELKEFLADPDDVPEEIEPKAKLGEIYKLGEHRLMCGDSTRIDSVERLMDGQKADMVFSDPPYNTGMTSESQKGSGGLWKGNGSAWLSHMFDDDYTPEEWDSFLDSFLDSFFKLSKDNSALYICLDWRRSHELIPKAKKLFKYSNLIIWDKVVHGLGSDYKYTHEFIHVFKKGKPKLNTHQGDDREYSDIWHIQRKIGKDEDHATKKPIEIVERAIRHASIKDQIVCDLFGGSGSTLIACEKTNRKCYMMELDPHYCDVIVARWEKFTGKKAELINGKA